MRMTAGIVFLLRTLRLIIVEQNNQEATSVAHAERHVLNFEKRFFFFLFVKVSLSWEFWNVVSTRIAA